jgi:hypothetical protein
MKVEIFTLCDYAAQYGERLCIVGTGEIFRSKKSGYVIQSKFLVYRIRFEASDKGKLRLGFSILDDCGKTITQFALDEFEPVYKNIYGFNAEIGIVPLETVVLPNVGVFSACIFANGELLESIPLFVFQTSGTG